MTVNLLVACALLVSVIAVIRMLRGPTAADRIVALDLLFAAAIVLCIAASFATRRAVFLDVALGLALVGVVATIGWASLIRGGSR